MLTLDKPLRVHRIEPFDIVDAHVHLGRWPEFDLSFELDDLESVMAQYGYSGAVVMPALVGDPLKANRHLLEKVGNDTRLYKFAWVGPRSSSYLDQVLVAWVGSMVALKAIVGMKFHPSISQVGLYDDRMKPFLEIADDFELPFLYHTGRTSISWPDRMMAIAPSYPKVKFILSHLGGNAYDRIYDTMKRWPMLPDNVWVESSTARHPDLLTRALEQWGGDRVLFGTDLPFTDQRLNFDCLRYAGLDRHTEFMGGTMLRLLK